MPFWHAFFVPTPLFGKSTIQRRESSTMTIPYNPASSKADEFINHEEIMETLAYADEKSQDKEFCLSLVEKASHLKGLSHRCLLYTSSLYSVAQSSSVAGIMPFS